MVNDRSSLSGQLRGLVLIGFIVAAALSRLIPHPPNLTPVGAMALFGGAYFGSRATAIAVPLTAMLLSDLVLAATHGWALGWMTVVIYGCIAVSVWLGIRLRSRVNVSTVATNSLLSALIFFIVTNLAVWAHGSFYPMDLSGLLACYVAALPFFGNTLAGYAVYGLTLFGGFAFLQRRFDTLALPTSAGV